MLDRVMLCVVARMYDVVSHTRDIYIYIYIYIYICVCVCIYIYIYIKEHVYHTYNVTMGVFRNILPPPFFTHDNWWVHYVGGSVFNYLLVCSVTIRISNNM